MLSVDRRAWSAVCSELRRREVRRARLGSRIYAVALPPAGTRGRPYRVPVTKSTMISLERPTAPRPGQETRRTPPRLPYESFTAPHDRAYDVLPRAV